MRNMPAFDSGNTTTNGVYQSDELCRWFSFVEIQSATNNFDNALVIGKGGFGKVYKGFIDGGATTVAIKRSNAESKQGAAEFWTEIKTLSKLRHTHLVTLIGYSDDCEEMILVYEYMANGTLADHLYQCSREGNGHAIYHLTWEERLKICIGAAQGLAYLHTDTEEGVIHRDVKTTNILLDENWVAKISDFGLSKMVNTSHLQTHVSTDVKGTFGYLDPAYFLTRRLTKKSDVYAFGVVLFEVLCARPPVDTSVEEEQIGLALWAQKCIKNGMLDEIIDPFIRGQISPNCLKVFAEVANKCLQNHSKGRPTMSEVVESLKQGMASHGNIRISRHKGIISNLFLSTADVVAKGIDLGWRKWKNKGPKNGMSWQLGRDPFADGVTQLYHRFSLAEIQAATNNFLQPVGMRLRGDVKVYRGHISTGNLEVAIKRWKEGTSRERNLDQFRAEIQVHSHLRHLHIVSLIGYCIDKHELILVYEYMVHGCLYHHLYETNKYALKWEKRLEICIGVARGLQYLHAGTRQTIIHRNLKPTNILLDENWNAKVITDIESSAGTVGYIDPEYYVNANLTIKSDVYSFGVILLELLCGRKPMIYSRDEDQVNLVRWFKTNIKRGTVDQIIDPYLIDKIAPKCLKEYVMNAENCVCDEGIERPSMDDVLGNLRYALQLQKPWQNSNDQFSTVESPEAVPSSDGTVIVELARRGDIDEMSLGSIGDSDFFSEMFDDWLTNHIQTPEEIWEFYEDKVLILSRSLVELLNQIIDYLNDIHERNSFNERYIGMTYGVIKYLRTVCEHARDVIQNAWSGKILNEFYQVFPDALRKIHFLMCTKFNDNNDCQKYLSAKNIVKLMRHSPFGYNELKFSIGCATDKVLGWDVIQNAWSGKILNELYQVFPDTLRKIHFLMCTKFNDDNDCQKYLSAKNIVKLMRHSPFGYNGLKFSIGCATDE
ncbi:unnamed protein product [Camellia sinensis]